jgi:hypothetical protein
MRYRLGLIGALSLACLIVLCQCAAFSGPTNMPAITCPDLQADAIHRLPFGSQDPDATLRWITETYHIDSRAVQRVSLDGARQPRRWADIAGMVGSRDPLPGPVQARQAQQR